MLPTMPTMGSNGGAMTELPTIEMGCTLGRGGGGGYDQAACSSKATVQGDGVYFRPGQPGLDAGGTLLDFVEDLVSP